MNVNRGTDQDRQSVKRIAESFFGTRVFRLRSQGLAILLYSLAKTLLDVCIDFVDKKKELLRLFFQQWGTGGKG